VNWPQAIFDETEQCWWTPIECKECGGYRHDLPIVSPALGDGALLHAQAAHHRHEEDGCMACRIEQARTGEKLKSGHSIFWYDVKERAWLSFNTVEGLGGVTMPLGIRFPASTEEADVAARMMMGSHPLPLRIIEPGLAVDDDLPSLYRDELGHYQLWLPCDECGGLHTTIVEVTSLEDAARQALQALAWVESEGCPACTTEMVRSNEDEAPSLWFDTLFGDWTMVLKDDGVPFMAGLGFGYMGVEEDALIQAADRLLARMERHHER
jgi:hypothetical protein